jgi:hypothetical protein
MGFWDSLFGDGDIMCNNTVTVNFCGRILVILEEI